MSGMTMRERLPTLLVIAAATGAAAGCGGSGGGGSGSDGKPDDSRQLAFAQCLRKAGIDAPDPKTDGNGRVSQRIGVPRGISRQRMDQIQADCQKKTGGGPKPMSREEQAKFRDAALKFAQCMRRNGVDVPDPQPGEGGISIGKDSGGSGPRIDPSSPAFQRAQKACASYLPGGGPAGKATQRIDGGSGKGAAFNSASDAP
jgi:hypothetical protein